MASKSRKNQASEGINLGSKLVIGSVKKVYSTISECLKNKSDISLYSDQIETIDITGIQLLVWAREMAAKQGLKFETAIEYSPAAADLIGKSGFTALLK
jgi:ABC-type transporter Mla MlaB component